MKSSKPFLFDRDNLREVFSGYKDKEKMREAGFSTLTELCNALIDKNASDSEYIIGLPGVGKTTLAKKMFSAQQFTKRHINKILSLDVDKMVFVTSDVEDIIAQQAKRITLLHANSQRIILQRDKRDEEIEEGISETAFGRSPRSTAHVSTDSSILISKLKTDYPEKSRVLMYRSSDLENWDHIQEFSVQNLSDKRKYIEEGVVAASGKRSPAQIVHIEYQIKKVIDLAHELGLSSYLLIGKNSGSEYDLGLKQSERMKIIDLEAKGQLMYIFSGTPEFVKNKKKVIKIVPEKSYAILGKERLPEGFEQGSYQELLDSYPEFLKHKDAYAVRAFAGYNFINMGNIRREDSGDSVSATFVRECLVKGLVDQVRPYLSPTIFDALTKEKNLAALQRRYTFIIERNLCLKQTKTALEERYKTIDPITQQPLLKRDGSKKLLTKALLSKYSDPSDQERILDYLDDVQKKIDAAEKRIKKKYRDLIYAQENNLVL